MTISLTTSLSSTIVKAELEENFTNLKNKFAAGIDNSDIKNGAAIAISKLAAAKEYVTIPLVNYAYTWGSAAAEIATVPLPGLSGTQANWTLKAASWYIEDTGTSAGTLDVVLTRYDSGGDLEDVTVLINEQALTVGTNNKGNSGQCTTITSSAVNYHASEARLLTLRQGAAEGAAVLNSAGSIGITLLLERDIQA